MTHSSELQVSEMFNSIAKTYDRVNRILSFGIDRSWRRELATHLPEGNRLHLLDLATGTGDQLLALMKTGKFQSAMGIDLSEGMLQIGQVKVDKSSYADKIILKTASALQIPAEEGEYDCVTISFGIRNVSDPLVCLKEIRRVLSQNGRALILEFSLPNNRWIRWVHLFYLRFLLPLIGGFISKEKKAYHYLNKTIEAFPSGESFLTLMRQAGFSTAQAIPLTFGIATLYIGEKK